MIFLIIGLIILIVFMRQVVVETTQRGGRHHVKKSWPDWVYVLTSAIGMLCLVIGIGEVFFPW